MNLKRYCKEKIAYDLCRDILLINIDLNFFQN
jgi:hypothetical protein